MKKLMSILLVFAMLFTVSLGVFARGGGQKADTGKSAVVKVEKDVVKDRICDKEKAPKDKHKNKLGEDAVAKIEAARTAFETAVAPLKEQLKTLCADLKAAKAADPVDKAAVKALKDKIDAINADIHAKQEELKDTIEKIKMIDKYGEEAVAKIEAAKAEYEATVASLNEKLKTLSADLKAAKSANPVDKAAVKALKEDIASTNAAIHAAQKALNDSIKSILAPVVTATPVVTVTPAA